VEGFLQRLRELPIDAAHELPSEILQLPDLALTHELSNYDAAYLRLAQRAHLALATNDSVLRRAAISAGVPIMAA
jgi:predicted nucleic acid-binding protein